MAPPRDSAQSPDPLTRKDVEELIATALAQHGASPALEAKIRELVAAHQGASLDDAMVTTLVERLTKDFVRIEEIRPDAMRRARPGMRP